MHKYINTNILKKIKLLEKSRNLFIKEKSCTIAKEH